MPKKNAAPGMMKKKAYATGGKVIKRGSPSSTMEMRGAGAATKGKSFTRSG